MDEAIGADLGSDGPGGTDLASGPDLPPLFTESNNGLFGGVVLHVAAGGAGAGARHYTITMYRGFRREPSSNWSALALPALESYDSWAAIAVTPANGDEVVVASAAGFVYRSSDGGAHFEPLPSTSVVAHPAAVMHLVYPDPGLVIASAAPSYLFRWSASHWTAQADTLGSAALEVGKLTLDQSSPGSPRPWLATSEGVFVYDAGGDSWQPQNAVDVQTVAVVGGGTATVWGYIDSASRKSVIAEPHLPLPIVHTCDTPAMPWQGADLVLTPTDQLVTDGVTVAVRDRYCATGGWNKALLAPLRVDGFYTVQLLDPMYVPASDHVMAGTSVGVWDLTTWGAWHEESSGLTAVNVRSMVADPSSSDHLFAATERGLYASSNGGATWAALGTTGGQPLPSLVGVTDVGASGSPLRLYALLDDSRLYTSDDSGASWTELVADPKPHFGMAVDPTDKNRVYLCGSGVLQTTNGADFSSVPATSDGAPCARIAVHPGTASVLYQADELGAVWRSDDHGATWAAWDKSDGSLAAWAFDPFDSERVIVGREATLLDVRKTGPKAPGPVAPTMDPILSLALDPVDKKTIYLGTTGGVYRSTNGLLFDAYSRGLGGLRSNFIWVNPATPSQVFVGLSGLGLWQTVAN